MKQIKRKYIIMVGVFIILTILNPNIYDFRSYLTMNNDLDTGISRKTVDEEYGYNRTSYLFIFSTYTCKMRDFKRHTYIGVFKTFFEI